MDWLAELQASLSWLGIAFVSSVLFLCVVGFIVIKTTRWGSQFWLIGGSYFNPRQQPRTIVLFALVLLLSLFGVRISVLFSNWYNDMYSALQDKDEAVFWIQMLVFAVLAGIHIIRALTSFYMQQFFVIKWRQQLNDKVLSQWLQNKNFYRFYFLKHAVDNPDQRIQQDVELFVDNALSLTMGVITNMVSAVAFTIILWNLSDTMVVFGVTIPRGMVFILFAYVLIATVFAFKIGRPLIQLSFLNERFNANYRYSLIRVREYAESIAFYTGEKIEHIKLLQSFSLVIKNAWDIVYRSLKFQGFNFFISQTAVVFPFIIQAPRFFSGQLSLGGMVQTAQAFGNLQDNLSFFRNAYDDFASFRAVLNRLEGFALSVDEAEALPTPNAIEKEQALGVYNLSVFTPSRRPLVKALNFEVPAGRSILIQGPSGVGKTTILRTMAGLWPYCEGEVIRPKDEVLFLSQKPYLPEGSILDILYYPHPVPEGAIQIASEILRKVNLGHLVPRIEEPHHWMHTLSLGEQQRVAFGRLLLARPTAAFLDEATSAMDEGLEDAMYRLVHEELPQLRLISVGHRSTLKPHHSHLLTIAPEGQWHFKELI